ncbi:V-type proton ATPase subunit C-like [Drosophila teissieri]|uniref:V-type proton ATPase subunit C-like n=1 Tax=Drosophila teissieri TaxID=7243 RepID=UPI001CBA06D7|nr:V-type proton ATPase subunit C-like [Drosophila teissieri]
MPCRHHQRIKHLSLRHQRKHQHTHHQNKPQHYHHHHHHHQLPQDLKGKSAATCSPATPPAPASAPPNLPPACACDVLAPGSLTGGSLTNLSTGHDPEPEFDACPCDECFACAPPSTSATASTLLADECYSQTASSMLSATRCALSTVAAIATGSGFGSGPSTSAAAAAAASSSSGGGSGGGAGPASCSTLCSSAYFSTSAPTTSSSVHSSMSRSNSKRLNNNTCSINNNKLSFRSGSHVSQLHLATQHPQQPPHHHSHPQSQPHSNPLQSPAQKSMSEDEGDASNAPEDGETDEDPKSPHSVQSDLSDAFDWWFNKPKRNSKKSRSSPVSSCCGSSSQGRSSPDTDPAEPPEFPLSPG